MDKPANFTDKQSAHEVLIALVEGCAQEKQYLEARVETIPAFNVSKQARLTKLQAFIEAHCKALLRMTMAEADHPRAVAARLEAVQHICTWDSFKAAEIVRQLRLYGDWLTNRTY
jgi:hypothetical protein